MYIKIQEENFCVEDEIKLLSKNKSGAVVSFIGYVRDFNESNDLKGIYLDCYTKMAYKQIESIIKQAFEIYNIDDARVVHRIGFIKAEDQIVLILVASKHRKEAFEACSYIIDFLKIKAPFFKKEIGTNNKEYWLDKFK